MVKLLVKPRAEATWHRRTKTPFRAGVYRTSRPELAPGYGGGYARWDGEAWCPYKNWGDYTQHADMLWSGTGVKCGSPLPTRKLMDF